MKKFERDFYVKRSDRDQAIKKLKSEPMFEYLSADIREGVVFPAIRGKNEIHFYCMGARLCVFSGKKLQQWHNTEEAPKNKYEYDQRKEACKKWGKTKKGNEKERATLSYYYKAFSPYTSNQSHFVLLDMEVGFPCLSEDKRDNVQVDLLFLDAENAVLYFIEAKEAGDGRIKKLPESGETDDTLYERLEVSEQVKKYCSNLEKREGEIITAYKNYVDVVREIFNASLDVDVEKLTIYPRLKLLVYGNPTPYGQDCLKAMAAILGEDLIEKPDARSLLEDDIVT